MRRFVAWPCAGLLLVALLAPLAAQQPPPPSDTDARIAFYKKRLGSPGTYPAYARLGAAYLQKARETGVVRYFDEAERYLLRSLGFQRNYEALRGLAAVHLEQHKFRSALTYVQEAVETMPGDPAAQGTLFDAYLALGETDKAAAVAEKMMSAEPGLPAHARLASLRHYRGELAGALEAMERACADAEASQLPAETCAWCQVRLGSFYLSRCEADKAEAAYQRALALFPDYYLAIEHLAELRAAQGKIADATALYRQLLKRNPDPRYRLALADMFELEGRKREADRERKRARKQLRRSVARGSLADLRPLALLLLADPKTAAEGLRLAERDWENRRDTLAADTLAWAYFQNGRSAEALEAIQEALRPGGQDPGVLLHAALIHHELGKNGQARTYLNQALACPLSLSPAAGALAEKLRADWKSPTQP